MTIDIYEDANAYYEQGHFGRIERPGYRDYLGRVSATQRDYSHMETCLGNQEPLR